MSDDEEEGDDEGEVVTSDDSSSSVLLLLVEPVFTVDKLDACFRFIKRLASCLMRSINSLLNSNC